MPEGHNIHRRAQDLTEMFGGQKLIVMSPQGRFEKQAKQLNGKQFNDASAHGKHLFLNFSRSRVHIHLGLYGKFRTYDNPPQEPQGAVRVRLIGSQETVDLHGPNRCELLDNTGYQKLVSRLGPDPLRNDADPEVAWKKISSSRAAIGTLLLNQSVIAGIGNVFRAEILYLLKINPERPGHQVTRAEFDALWKLTVQLMQIGVKHNRIITVDRKQLGKPLSQAKSSERLNVYKQPVCHRCGADIYYWELGARTIYACDQCQV